MVTDRKVINTYQELLNYLEKTQNTNINIYQKCKIENIEPKFVEFRVDGFDCEEEDFWSYVEYVWEHQGE